MARASRPWLITAKMAVPRQIETLRGQHVALEAVSMYFTGVRNGLAEDELTDIVIEPKPGTYALVLSSASNSPIQIGRLGTLQLQCGYYIYLGSALGPGGLRARIMHHQKPAAGPHWHIDYLRAQTELDSVWLNYDGKRHEHAWARAMQKVKNATIPLRRFGASDCSCASHLYFMSRRPLPLRLVYKVKRNNSANEDEQNTYSLWHCPLGPKSALA